jgi:hypothetical protein
MGYFGVSSESDCFLVRWPGTFRGRRCKREGLPKTNFPANSSIAATTSSKESAISIPQESSRYWKSAGSRGSNVGGYFPAFCFAHRFFCAAAILARASGLMVRFFLALAGLVSLVAAFPSPLIFAQRARAAAAIRARPAADIVRLPPRLPLLAAGLLGVAATLVFPVSVPKIC